MDQSDVLARIGMAREKVAQTIANVETGRKQVQELLSSTAEHFTHLNDEFTACLSHLQEEAARAQEAAQQVVEALQHAAAELLQASQQHHQSISDLIHAASDATQGNDAGSLAIEQYGQQISARLQASHALFNEAQEGVTHGRDSHAVALNELHSVIGDWHSQSDVKSQQQRDAIDRLTQQLTGESVQQLAQSINTAIDSARATLDERQHDMQERSEKEADAIRSDRERARDEMSRSIDEMREALSTLGNLASSTSETLTDGADEAMNLMKMTNVGVNTVIGLIENLKEIFDEIESAWS